MKSQIVKLPMFGESVVHEFDSVEEQIQYAQTATHRHFEVNIFESAMDYTFVGRRFKNQQDIFAQARTKDDDIIRLCEENANLVDETETPLTFKRKRIHARHGKLNVRGYIRGAEHPWTKLERREKVGPKLVNLVVQLNASSMYTSSQLAWKTVTAMLLSEKLEDAGYAVSLYCANVGHRTYTNGAGKFMMTRVKDSSEELNLASLSAALSPWFYRSIGFISYAYPKLVCDSGMGSAYRGEARQLEPIFAPFISDPIVIEQSYSKEDCIKNVNAVISRLKEQE